MPYIYEDRVSREDFISALRDVYDMSKGERRKLGLLGRQHVLSNYGHENYCKQWDSILKNVHKECGSWDTRQGYNRWEIREVL